MASYCEDSPVKRKKRKTAKQKVSSRRCIIHITDSNDDVTEFTEISWKVNIFSLKLFYHSYSPLNFVYFYWHSERKFFKTIRTPYNKCYRISCAFLIVRYVVHWLTVLMSRNLNEPCFTSTRTIRVFLLSENGKCDEYDFFQVVWKLAWLSFRVSDENCYLLLK